MCLHNLYNEKRQNSSLKKCQTDKIDGKYCILGYKIVILNIPRNPEKPPFPGSGIMNVPLVEKWNRRERSVQEINIRREKSYTSGCHLYIDAKMATEYFMKAYKNSELTDTYFLIPVYFLKADVVVTGEQKHQEGRCVFKIPTAVAKKYYIQPEIYQQMLKETKTVNLCKNKKA